MGSNPHFQRGTSIISEGGENDYSSIQPDNIPIPLGLPIVYFHDNDYNQNLDNSRSSGDHEDQFDRRKKPTFLSRKAGRRKKKVQDISKTENSASLNQQMVLREIQNRRNLSRQDSVYQTLEDHATGNDDMLYLALGNINAQSADILDDTTESMEELDDSDGWESDIRKDESAEKIYENVEKAMDANSKESEPARSSTQVIVPAPPPPARAPPAPVMPTPPNAQPLPRGVLLGVIQPPGYLAGTRPPASHQKTASQIPRPPNAPPPPAPPPAPPAPRPKEKQRQASTKEESAVNDKKQKEKSTDADKKRSFITAESLRREIEKRQTGKPVIKGKLITAARLRKEIKAREVRAKNLTPDQRFEKLQRLFLIIQMGSVIEMKSYLKHYCNPVEIVPKFGCKKRYYSEINLVNARDHFGNCPLLLSCKMGSSRNEMTMLLLKYGANPNQVDEFMDCPLVYVAQSVSLTPTDENIEILRELLLHGADIMQAVKTLCETLETPNKESRTAMMSLTALLQPEFLILTKDPIKTAHQANSMLQQVSSVKEEYTTDCNILAKSARDFAYGYLDSCRTLWEARRLLCGSNYIENALETKEKRFLSHPFCQEIILEEFYGNKDFKSFKRKALFISKSFTSFFLGPLYFISVIHHSLVSGTWQYKCSRLDFLARGMLTPFYSFLCDLFNYAILLALLILVSITVPPTLKLSDEDTDSTESYAILRRNASIALSEVTLWLCVLSRFMFEVYQFCMKGPRKYFSNFWNYVDVLICALSITACAIRFWNSTAAVEISRIDSKDIDKNILVEDFKTTTMTSIYIYSITQVFVFFRLMNFLDVMSGIGPLQLAVKRMLNDVAKLMVLLVIILLGFVCAVFSVANCYRNVKNSTDFEEFSSFEKASVSMTWTLFDIYGYSDISRDHMVTYWIILILVLVYSVIGAIIILNTLIAMLNNTYVEIQSNEDTEWKYSRCELFSEYKKGIPWLFPFNLILTPVYIVYRVFKKFKRRKQKKQRVYLEYDHLLEKQQDYDVASDAESVEMDAESGITSINMEDDPVVQELKMRYLLINELAKRIDLSKHL